MKDSIYTSRSRIQKVRGLTFGVHGPIKAQFGLDDEPDLPLPVDYLVASGAG